MGMDESGLEKVQFARMGSAGGPSNETFGMAARRGARRLVLSPCIPNGNKTKSKAANVAGQVIGWVSSVLYLNSRLPQIWKNCSSRSVEGLSWVMFAMAFMGNLTSLTAILLRISGKQDWVHEAPFLPGMAGTLFFDMTIMIQYFVFSAEATNRRGRRAQLREEARKQHRLGDDTGSAGGASKGDYDDEGEPLLLDAEVGQGRGISSINRDGKSSAGDGLADLSDLLQDTPAMVPS